MSRPLPLVQAKPTFTPEEAQAIAARLYGLTAQARELTGERDQNFRLQDAAGNSCMLKFANRLDEPALLEMQNQMLTHIAQRDPLLPCPRLLRSVGGVTIEQVQPADGVPCYVRLLSFLPGAPLAEVAAPQPELLFAIGQFLGRLDIVLQDFTHPAMHRELHWDLKHGYDVTGLYLDYLTDPVRREIVEQIRQEFAAQVLPNLSHLRRGVIHGDANDHNILVSGREVSGLIDFGDAVHTATVFEPAISAAYLMLGTGAPLAAAAQLVAGYHSQNPLIELETALLYPLIRMRLATSVVLSAFQQKVEPANPYLVISEQPAWELLEQMRRIRPAEVEGIFRLACGRQYQRSPKPARSLSRERLAELRRRYLGPSLSLSYREPLKIVRGAGQYLYDEQGRAYLDCVNNVSTVGHSHPRLVAAASRQLALLNTNTRYLHDNLVAYAERLTSLLPEPLRVCYFVCSGSEANELALRLAWSYTGRKDLIVLDAAYHGNTSTLVEISPYKHNGPGGKGPPPYVYTAPLPDPYRGRWKGYSPDTGARYAREVQALIETTGGPGPAAFIAESLPGCGGQIVFPDGYLSAAYGFVRAAGGVCIADEVQVGFGRVGSHFWGFELQGVTPDIVTMGKPIGNGHPLAAVVTTPEIARAFANGMEYFNTFGGNPVSCAVGLAVLDVIQEEALQENALRVGGYLLGELRALADTHRLIGHVRGKGLFIGIELVSDRETLAPAAAETTEIVERMKDRGILLSIDGPLHNVIKIKPPLVFDRGNAEQLATALDDVLSRLE